VDSNRDRKTEALVHTILANAVAEQRKSITGPELRLNGFSRLCLQRPYMTVERFRSSGGLRARGFRGVGDEASVWWLVDEGGDEVWIRIPAAGLIDIDEAATKVCFHPDRVSLELKQRSFNGKPYWTYTLVEK
jgi:hypothetical protein